MSMFTRHTDSTTFRLRWRGYDRAQVDRFLRQTDLDRQRLQEDLAQIEAAMAGHGEERRRELERLSALRTEVASCLETSIGALRTATERLSSSSPAIPEPQPLRGTPGRTSVPARAVTARPWLRWPLPARWVSGSQRRVLVAVGSTAVLMLAAVLYQYQPRGIEMPARAAEQTRRAVSESSVAPVASVPPAAVVQEVEGLVLTLTARRTCWIGTTIDGGQRLERVLKPGETIMLRADREALLRVGDAAALSLLINNELAKPLGAPGQVVTTLVTRANYRSFLAGPLGN